MDDDAFLNTFRQFFEEARQNENFLSFLDAELLDVDRGHVELYVPSDPYLYNPGGIVHGAVTAGLVDMACGLSIRSDLGPEQSSSFQTVDLNVSYIRPATEDLYAEGKVIRAGDHIGVARAEVKSDAPDGERKVVVSGQATFFYE